MANLIGTLCFILFGVAAFTNPLNPLSPYHIAFGVVAGLVFGWLFTRFLRGFLRLANGKYVKENEGGKAAIKEAVSNGKLFLAPFAVMMLIATFYLQWSTTAPLISAGVMAVGTGAALEFGKAKGSQEVRNTIATSAVAFAFSFLCTMTYGFTSRMPAYLEGGVALVRSLLNGGGGL